MADLRYDGRVAIVTGAGSGLGRAHAKMLAARGAAVVVNELPATLARAEQVRDEILGDGGDAIAVAARVGDDEDARRLVDASVEHFGRLDILISNAGNTDAQDLVDSAPGEALELYLDVHVRGPQQINRAAWPRFVRQAYGRLLFTGSANGTGWMKGSIGYEMDYAIAKAAVFALTRQIAASGLEHGIKANMVMPWAYTPMVETALGGTELGRWMEANLRPEQVSAAIALLLHEDCPVTGETITTQGGRIARVFFAATRGYFNPSLTPEDVRDNWDEVIGRSGDDGRLVDVFELTQPREERVIRQMLEAQALPDLLWIAQQPLHASLHSTDVG